MSTESNLRWQQGEEEQVGGELRELEALRLVEQSVEKHSELAVFFRISVFKLSQLSSLSKLLEEIE